MSKHNPLTTEDILDGLGFIFFLTMFALGVMTTISYIYEHVRIV